MSIIEGKNRNQLQIFSSIEDRVDKNSIVRVIDKIVDKLVTEEEETETRVGRPEYSKKSLLKLFIWGYMDRTKSSRRLEKACKVNNEVIWLMEGLTPDHWTINKFRMENEGLIREVTQRFTKFLIDTGYAEGKEIVIDGTKMKANASVDSVIRIDEIKERISDAEKKIVYYLEALRESQEDELIYEELKQENERLKKEKEELEEKVKNLKESNKRYYVETDPDASLMKTREGTRVAYNIQFVCDSKNKLIITTNVSSDRTDNKQLTEVYDKTKEILGEDRIEELICDSGYYVPEEIEKIENRDGVDTYITPLPEQSKGEFEYDEERDEYICSMGVRLRFKKQSKDRRGRVVRYYQSKGCHGCPIKVSCTESNKGRTKLRYINQEFRDNYREKMRKEYAIEKIKKRKQIIEHPIGTIKMWLGKCPILLRGREKVQTELNLVQIGYNILRVFNIVGFERLMTEISKIQIIGADC